LLIGIVLLALLPLAWLVSVAVRESLAGIAFLRQTLQTHGRKSCWSAFRWLVESARSALESFSASADELTALAKARGPATAVAVAPPWEPLPRCWRSPSFLIAFYFLMLDGRRWCAGGRRHSLSGRALAIATHSARAARSVLSRSCSLRWCRAGPQPRDT